MRAVQQRYLREFLPAMVAYVALLFLSVWLLPQLAHPVARIALALLPALPIMLVIRAMVRVIRDQDELERRIDLEAIAIACMVTGFGFFSYGLLAGADVVPAARGKGVAIWVFPTLCATFGLAKCGFVARPYRQ